MLEIKVKDALRFRIKPLADKNGNLVRESKPFRSDNQVREFITAELFGKAIKDEEGNEDLGVESDTRIIKNLWSHRHTKTFNRIADLIEEDRLDADGFVIGVNLKAVDYKLPCKPYYILDNDGNRILRADNTPRIGHHVRFVLLENENTTVEQEYLNACSDLPYVTGDEDLDTTDEREHEPPVEEQQQQQQQRQGRRNR